MGCYHHSSYVHGTSVKRSRNQNDRKFDVSEYADRLAAHYEEENTVHFESYGFHKYPLTWTPPHDGRMKRSFIDGEPWTYLGCPYDTDIHDVQRNPHTDAIIIETNGVCYNNGTPDAKGAFGVFFHRNNFQYNRAFKLPEGQPHTNQRAQLFAALQALRLAKHIRERNIPGNLSRDDKKSPLVRLHHVIIKTSTEYVSKSMDEWIWKWEESGYFDGNGQSVVNENIFRAMHSDIAWLNARDVHVDFWVVPKNSVKAAHCLAKAALAGISAQESVEDCVDYQCSCLP